MPELKPTLGYVGRLRRLETRYLSGVNDARVGFRRSMLDMISTYGVKLSMLPTVRREIDNLRAQVNGISRQQADEVDEVTLWYINQQLGVLRRINEPRLPNIQQLNQSTYSDRRSIYDNTLSSSAWIDSLQQSMEINYTRLAVANADLTTAVDRLLAVSISDGRASVYRMSGVAAQTQVSNTIWTASMLAASGLFKRINQVTQTVYEKQAIAAIDQKTTDCCLRVHGQIQPLDKPFILDGYPRYSDKIDSPPFHWNAILAGEMCMTIKGKIPIENVRVGDRVLTHAGRFMPVTMALLRKHTGKVLEIETSGGIIRVTPEHPILTTIGWMWAEFLRQGDTILGCDITQSLPPVWANAGTLNTDSQDGIPERAEELISRDISIPAGTMATPVNLKANIQLWKEKVNDILADWLLKFEVCAQRIEPVYKCLLDYCRVCAVSVGTAYRLSFCDTRHVNRVLSLHSLGSNRITDTNPRMSEPIPFSDRRFYDPPSFNTGFFQSPFNDIARNAKLFSDHILGNTRSVPGNNFTDININSGRHNDLLPFKHYTINKIVTLELQNSIVCDLSIEGDESYCINGHYVHNCRSAMSLYTKRMEEKGIPTAEMVDAAQAELNAREETGAREEIWPSSATSRRGR